MSLTVKAYLLTELDTNQIRRFAIDQDVSTSYTYLRSKILQIFPDLKNKQFQLFWKDSEDDMIAFSSDEEQLEALGFVNDGVFKVYIKTEAEKKKKPSQEPDNDILHPGIVCDGCEGSIRGIRYKCMVCSDYDLCTPCEGKGVHTEHNMKQITTPINPFMGFHGCFPPPPPHYGPPPFHHGPPPPPHGPPPPEGEEPHGPWGGPMFGPGMFGPGMFGPWGRGGRGNWHNMKRHWKKWARGEGWGNKPEQKPKEDGTKPKVPESDSSDEGEHSPSEDYLKKVGANVAAMLDPLGIDVEIDVEHGDRHCRFNGAEAFGGPPGSGPWAYAWTGGHGRCGRGRGMGRCPRRGANCKDTPSKPQEKPKDDPQEKPTDENPTEPTQEKDVEMETGEATGAAASGGGDTDMEIIQPQDTETGEAGDDAKPKDEDKKSSDKDWTLLEAVITKVPDSDTITPPATATGIYPDVPQPQQPEPSLDPAIVNALDHMSSMGFKDEGGWLTNLLLVTKGDINKALDAIRANRKQ